MDKHSKAFKLILAFTVSIICFSFICFYSLTIYKLSHSLTALNLYGLTFLALLGLLAWLKMTVTMYKNFKRTTGYRPHTLK